MPVDMIHNIGLLALLAIGFSLIRFSRFIADNSIQSKILVGILFGSVAAVVMFNPIVVPQGATFDTRGGPAILVGIYGGGLSTLVASVIGAIARYQVGGPSAVGGAASFIFYGLAGLGAHFALRKLNRRPDIPTLILIGIFGTFCVLPAFFIGQTWETGIAILQVAWPILLTGNVAGVFLLGYVLELDERRRQETIEAQNHKKFAEGIFDAQPSHIAVIDPDGNILTVNTEWHVFYQRNGGKPKNWVGENYYSHCLSDQKTYGDKLLSDKIKSVISNESNGFEHLFPCHSPTEKRWFLMMVRSIKWSGKTGAIIMHINVTDRVVAEMRATEEGQRYRSLVEHSLAGIITINDQGIVQNANKAIEEIFGFTPDELIGNNVSKLMPEPQKSEHDGYIETYLKTGKSKVINTGREVWAAHKNGKIFPVHISVSADRSGPTPMFSGVIIDLTKQHEMYEQMEKAKEIAEAANLAKSEFLSSMSHELRTPLNSILGFSQVIASDTDTPLNDTHQKAVNHILNSGHILLGLINQVLDLSKIESGKVILDLEACDLDALIKETLPVVEPLAEKNNIQVFYERSPNLIQVRADSFKLKQVILNLLSNAIKYNEPNGQVTITAKSTGLGFIRTTISDTGLGIPKERQGEVFGAFQRLGAERSAIEGTGVGLTITKHLVELHNGTIGFNSDLGKGSDFWFDIPVSRLSKQHTTHEPKDET
ncbi:MAG: PAS domain S-box protein [Rhodospirillales bacterium]|nr:PAS domain S-box protein [Rhodospirillales bacterium]